MAIGFRSIKELVAADDSREKRIFQEELDKEVEQKVEDVKITAKDVLFAALKTAFFANVILLVSAYSGGWAVLGGWADLAKKALVFMALWAAVYHSIWVFVKVLPAATVLALVFRVSVKGNQDAIAGVPSDVHKEFRVLGWVLASEFFIALVTGFVPFHNRPDLIPWFYISALGAMTYAIYKRKGEWWINVVGAATIGSMLLMLGYFFISDESSGLAQVKMVQVFMGKANIQTMFWFIVGAILASSILTGFISKEKSGLRKVVGFGIPFLAVAFLVQWFMWGGPPSVSEIKGEGGKLQGQLPELAFLEAREQELCPGDGKNIPAGVEKTYFIGVREGCFVNWTHIPSAGSAEAWLIYPGGKERGPFMVTPENSLERYMTPEHGRPISFKVRAITDIAVHGYYYNR